MTRCSLHDSDTEPSVEGFPGTSQFDKARLFSLVGSVDARQPAGFQYQVDRRSAEFHEPPIASHSSICSPHNLQRMTQVSITRAQEPSILGNPPDGSYSSP